MIFPLRPPFRWDFPAKFDYIPQGISIIIRDSPENSCSDEAMAGDDST
jgi:hypothetical protein